MILNENTKLTDLLKEYPKLPAKLKELDPRASMIDSAVGRMMIKNKTVKDAAGMLGMTPEQAVKELEGLIKTL
ncbi:MAG: hypothetical protein K6G17_06020 [Oscillospiraceae bacterium]|nr:hypothetical protein [Oscillospiraceae bacterium]